MLRACNVCNRKFYSIPQYVHSRKYCLYAWYIWQMNWLVLSYNTLPPSGLAVSLYRQATYPRMSPLWCSPLWVGVSSMPVTLTPPPWLPPCWLQRTQWQMCTIYNYLIVVTIASGRCFCDQHHPSSLFYKIFILSGKICYPGANIATYMYGGWGTRLTS